MTPIVSMTRAESGSARRACKPGRWDAAQAAWNMRMISTTPPSDASAGCNSLGPGLYGQVRHPGQLQRVRDLGHLQSSEAGARERVSRARHRRTTYPFTRTCCSCRPRRRTAARTASSAAFQIRSARIACAASAIFDISDVAHPKLVTSVQTCRGSHTHTVVTQPGDPTTCTSTFREPRTSARR